MGKHFVDWPQGTWLEVCRGLLGEPRWFGGDKGEAENILMKSAELGDRCVCILGAMLRENLYPILSVGIC